MMSIFYSYGYFVQMSSYLDNYFSGKIDFCKNIIILTGFFLHVVESTRDSVPYNRG